MHDSDDDLLPLPLVVEQNTSEWSTYRQLEPENHGVSLVDAYGFPPWEMLQQLGHHPKPENDEYERQFEESQDVPPNPNHIA